MGLVADTSALASLERGSSAPDELMQRYSEQILVPAVVWGELHLGIHLATGAKAAKRKAWLARLRELFWIVPVDEKVAEQYALLRAELLRRGTPIPTNDTWIASAARAWSFGVLVGPANEAHYHSVPSLRVELLRPAP